MSFWEFYAILVIAFGCLDIFALSTGLCDPVLNITKMKWIKLAFCTFHIVITFPLGLRVLGVI